MGYPSHNSPSRLWTNPETKSTPPQPQAQSLENLRWKWAGSTILLSYGQMAAKAKSQILPWVDNILSRMIFYFRFSSWVQGPSITIPHPTQPCTFPRTEPGLQLCPATAAVSERPTDITGLCPTPHCPSLLKQKGVGEKAHPPLHCPGTFIIPWKVLPSFMRTPSPTSYKANAGFFLGEE